MKIDREKLARVLLENAVMMGAGKGDIERMVASLAPILDE